MIEIKILGEELRGEIYGFKTKEEAMAAAGLLSGLGMKCVIEKEAAAKRPVNTEAVRILTAFFERKISRKLEHDEVLAIAYTLMEHGVEPEVIAFAADYYSRLRIRSVDNILALAVKLKKAGCKTKEDVKRLLG